MKQGTVRVLQVFTIGYFLLMLIGMSSVLMTEKSYDFLLVIIAGAVIWFGFLPTINFIDRRFPKLAEAIASVLIAAGKLLTGVFWLCVAAGVIWALFAFGGYALLILLALVVIIGLMVLSAA
jgi:predicted PurR-regulated permease PerM